MDHHQLAASLLSNPTFDVIAWADPVCDHGLPTDSDEALVILCPVLGPSATLMLHRLARYASTGTTTSSSLKKVQPSRQAGHIQTALQQRYDRRPQAVFQQDLQCLFI